MFPHCGPSTAQHCRAKPCRRSAGDPPFWLAPEVPWPNDPVNTKIPDNPSCIYFPIASPCRPQQSGRSPPTPTSVKAPRVTASRRRMARSVTVSPFPSSASGSAPASRSALTAADRPPCAGVWSGHRPSGKRDSMFTPCSIRTATLLASPELAAACGSNPLTAHAPGLHRPLSGPARS